MRVLIGVDGSKASLDAVRTAGHLVDPTADLVALLCLIIAAVALWSQRGAASP